MTHSTRFLLPLTAVIAVFSAPARAEVFEISSDGALVNITQQQWRPAAASPVLGDMHGSDVQPALSVAQPAASAAIVRQHIQYAAARYGLNSALVDAVAWQESRYRHSARSPVGAIGVMQLMPGTARDLGLSDPTDLAQNIAGGTAYLRAQLDRFGNNIPLALAAYNAGPGAVQRFGGIPPYRETQNYVRQIMNRLAQTAITVGID